MVLRMTEPRTWIITGAGRGLGLALTDAVLGSGDVVVALTRSGTMPREHTRLHTLRADVSSREACFRAVEDAMRLCGRVDVLVNNAGYGLVSAIEEVDETSARDIVDTDLLGPLWLTQAVLPHLRRSGGGDIVQISSVGGVGAMAFFGLYNAAKWGLEGFSEALAGEVAPFGIRVTIAEIGAMDTQWATGSMRFAAPDPAYDDAREATLGTATVPWPVEATATGGGTAPSDIAEHLLRHVDAGGGTPLRLVLGEDAHDQVATVMNARALEYGAQR